MSDRFKEAMITIGVSALMAVVVTYGLLENEDASEGVWVAVFMIAWGAVGIAIALVLPDNEKWKDKWL